MARVRSSGPRVIRSLLGVVVGGALIATANAGVANATETDLHSGLAHLRAGAQAQAEQDLRKYRDGERDARMRQSIDRVLPLLRRPLTDDVREFIAATVEEGFRLKGGTRAQYVPPSYLSRMFPVFP